MKKLILSFIIGFLLLLIFVLAMAPARIVLPWFTQGLPQLSLNQPSGSIWNATLDSISFQGRSIHNISAQTGFWSLLLGNIHSEIQIDDQQLFIDGSVQLNSKQVSINKTDYELDAGAILDWVRLPITELSGRFAGEINELELAPNEIIKLDARGVWQNAVVGYPNSVLELGDIHFTIERTDEGRALLTITENPGMLDLEGTLEVGFDKQYQLNLSTQTDTPAHIKQWLTQLGRIENNRVIIKWNGRLP
ncbi:type II secretion system protein N [Kangiella aquimarina]|uniref:Type II secretion system protein N n=1 Tax=Kangiella aquimarina TaxID=261965 RepID=A0ABZ0X6G7_9GAMM|nr:type II secretion system protein N [Kangiella aquimarina]WQG85944.1 type II secretion system protein N [Kangiella aquimarina]